MKSATYNTYNSTQFSKAYVFEIIDKIGLDFHVAKKFITDESKRSKLREFSHTRTRIFNPPLGQIENNTYKSLTCCYIYVFRIIYTWNITWKITWKHVANENEQGLKI